MNGQTVSVTVDNLDTQLLYVVWNELGDCRARASGAAIGVQRKTQRGGSSD